MSYGETEAASETLVGLGFASATFLAEEGAGPALALQEVLARWAPHYAESAPQPPGFAGVTCLLSTVFGCTTLQKDLRVHISLQTVFCPFGNLSFPICNIGHIGIFCIEVCRDLWENGIEMASF